MSGVRSSVLWALMLVGLVTMMAVVVDLGHLREAKATTQGVADLAALAAGERMSTQHPDPRAACQDAVGFIRMNLSDLPTAASVPCANLPATCSAATAKTVVHDNGTAGRYRIEITYPVPDADILDGRTATGLRKDDGQQCDRVGVAVRRTNEGYFSGAIGVNELSAKANAVARRSAPGGRRVPNLWLLDPTGCPVLSTQGNSALHVGTSTHAGLITIDSDGSECGGNSYTLSAGGSSRVRVHPIDPAPGATAGEIGLFAMRPGQRTCAEGNLRACNPSQIGANANVWPQPGRREERATRAIVDHRYNCRSSSPATWHSATQQYAPYPEGMAASIPRIPMANCTDPQGKPFVDQLRQAVGTTGRPTGFQRWTQTDAAGLPRYSCQNPVVPAELPGNWWIDCPGGLSIGSGTLNFTGGNIVFDGDLTMNGGLLRVNSNATTVPAILNRVLSAECLGSISGCLTSSSPRAAWVYFRNGSIRFSSNPVLEVNRAAVIQDGGILRMSGQAPPRWTAPTEGPFRGLGLWSERVDSGYLINGGSGMQLDGVFFTPHATFTVNGGGGLLPQKAQFISYRLELAGGGTLTLEPDLANQIPLPAPPAGLIR